MNKEHIERLKKYLFFISMFFSFLLFSHMVYVYFFYDAKEIPIEGGSISEGVIGDFPDLNPLLGKNDYNKNIIFLLYRSLMKYDSTEKKLVGDLANCELKDLGYIECYLKTNIMWSDGSNITIDDILSTYNILKNSDINPVISSLLKETTIENKNGILTFTNKIKDINFLSVLMQPIVQKNILDNIGNKELYGKFNPVDGVFSGPYKIDTVSYDDSLGIQKLILIKNEHYTEENILISKYIIKFFKDASHFLKSKDNISLFFDTNNIIGDTIPRLQKNTFGLNKYVSVFLNEETIKDPNLRNFILEKINRENIIKNLGSGYNEVTNPFLLSGKDMKKEIESKNIEGIIKELGYYKKDILTPLIVKQTGTGEKIVSPPTTNTTINNSSLTHINSPINTKYTFLSKDNVLIKGNTLGENVSAVYFNDYKLSAYKSGSKDFYYKLSEIFKNIKIGENTYKVYFEINGQKKLVEEFTIFYDKDEKKLSQMQNDFFKTNTPTTPPIEKQQEKKISTQNLEQQISNLDNKFYYNKDLKKFTYRLYYLDNQSELVKVANIIKNNIETYGISVETLPISISQLNEKIVKNEKDYDMILAGIDLGYFDYNIYPYFHSSQAKEGYNFSNTRDLNLDMLLEELKTKNLSPKIREQNQIKILEMITEKQVIKTLYSKESIVLIDKNVKNFNIPYNNMPSNIGINEKIIKSYIVSEKDIKWEQKGGLGFIKFIIGILKNEGKTQE